jgi:Holliday junction resolvase
MALTPEKKVKDKVVKLLKQYGVYYFFPATHGFGRSGVPDVVCCIRGHFFAVECKAGTNTPTALQEKEIADIRKAGGTALVINETNLTMLERALIKLTGANPEENDDDGRC